MIIAGILLFALLVVVHELGHYLVARRNGVEVEEFGIGFPPRIFGRKIGDTEYTFNLIPLGGFVKLKGESDSDSAKGSFGASSFWVKARILLAGVGMNVVAAAVIILVLAISGLPHILPNQYQVPSNQTIDTQEVVLAQVGENTAASRAGLEVGDRVVAVNNSEITSAQQLRDRTEELAGEEVSLAVERDGEAIELDVALGVDEEEGYLGVSPLDLTSSRYSWAAPLVAIGVTLQMIGLVFMALWNIVVSIFAGAGGAADQLTGPVGIVFLLQNLGDFGWSYLMFLIASISISLAVFNVLPIPALDGGRLSLIAGARLLKKRLKPELENAVHGLGFILLIGVFVLITYVDIQRFF